MRAAGKAALPQIGRKLTEGMLQIVPQHQIHLFGFKRGKSRRIRQIAAREGHQLNMAGGVPPPSNPVGNRANRPRETGVEPVQQAGLAHARIPGKGRNLPIQPAAQLVDTRAGLRAHPEHVNPRRAVGFIQRGRRVEVGLVQHNQNLHALVLGDGKHLVNQERLGLRGRRRRDRREQPDIRHRRTDERGFARLDFQQESRPVLGL